MTFQIFRSQKKSFFENFTFLETSNLDVSRKVKFSEKKLFFKIENFEKSYFFLRKSDFFEKPKCSIFRNYFLENIF